MCLTWLFSFIHWGLNPWTTIRWPSQFFRDDYELETAYVATNPMVAHAQCQLPPWSSLLDLQRLHLTEVRLHLTEVRLGDGEVLHGPLDGLDQDRLLVVVR